MNQRVHYHPNMIYSEGTQIVTILDRAAEALNDLLVRIRLANRAG